MVYTQLFNFRVLVFLVAFISNFSLIAQKILWEKTYGGLQAEYLFDAQPTADYGFILAGSSLSDKSGNKTVNNVKDLDYWIWKMDEIGDLDWQKSFGGDGSDFLKSIKNTRDGGFILGGTSSSMKGNDKKEESRGQDDVWIIKLNANGDEEWQKTFGGKGKDELTSIAQTKDGGYILGGSSTSKPSNSSEIGFEKKSPNYGNMDFWVIKIDAQGTIEWEKTYGGQYKDKLESIEQTKDEGYIVGGYSNSPVSGNKTAVQYGEGDYWIFKLDKTGEIEWQTSMGGEQDDHLYVVTQIENGSYIAAGNSNSTMSQRKEASNKNGTDFWVVSFEEGGEILWEKTYDFGETDILTSLVKNKDGSFLLGGFAQSEKLGLKTSNKKGINDYVALKIDAEGEELWRQTVGSSGQDVLQRLIMTRDGGYLLAGTSAGKISRDKNTVQGRSDFWVVKLKDEDKEDEDRSFGLEAFPNPANSFTNVIVNHDFEDGTATVFDISGRQMQHFSIKNRTVPVNMSGYPEGVYLVVIKTNVKSGSVKILKGVNRN